MDPAIHLSGAVSLLGRFPAMAGVDLDVVPGEVVLLQGPNGAGKSTILRACAGLLPVVDGEARVLGHDLRRDRKAVRRRVGLLGHDAGLYDELTVADNVRFWARAARSGLDDADAAMVRLGLDGRLRDVAVSSLSAGQRRRTSLAVMLARRPELWLLDEPHAGLDPAGRDVVDELVNEAGRVGVTVLIASHDLDRAAALAGRRVQVVGGMIRPPAPAGSPAGSQGPTSTAGAQEKAGAPGPDGAEPIGPSERGPARVR